MTPDTFFSRDAPGDLSIDGRNWTTAKDYAELHSAVHAITTHLINRYGDRCLEFPWSVFHEPDLGVLFWRSDWNELQKFYDYTVDAILRAFEDRGYDSDRVFVGGLELGGIFGTNLKLREFLVHCSPRAAEVPGALLPNAAFADPRLDGRRSRRVESLCRAHDGRGSPCDFVSIHAYNTSQLMADKLARAKEMALEIDADYYTDLWVNSHESCPGWDLPPDPAYSDSYLGNGYYPTWCADVTRRRLTRAAADSRYGYGESILTFWPWPCRDFEGRNDCVRDVRVDDDGDGFGDRTITLPMPILHFLGLLNRMQEGFRVLPEQSAGGHVISGFAAREGRQSLLLVYSHHMLDTQSRSGQSFDVSIDVRALPSGRYEVREYPFDRDHNSYFRLAKQLRDQPDPRQDPSPEKLERLRRALAQLESTDRDAQRVALDEIASLNIAGNSVLVPLFQFAQRTEDAALRERTVEVVQRITSPRAYTAEVVSRIEKLSRLQESRREAQVVKSDGRLTLRVLLPANAASFLILTPIEND